MKVDGQKRRNIVWAHARVAGRGLRVCAQNCAFLPRFYHNYPPPLRALRNKIYLAFFRALIGRARGELFHNSKFTIKGEL